MRKTILDLKGKKTSTKQNSSENQIFRYFHKRKEVAKEQYKVT